MLLEGVVFPLLWGAFISWMDWDNTEVAGTKEKKQNLTDKYTYTSVVVHDIKHHRVLTSLTLQRQTYDIAT